MSAAPAPRLVKCLVERLAVGNGGTELVPSHYYRRIDGVWTCINCGHQDKR